MKIKQYVDNQIKSKIIKKYNLNTYKNKYTNK